jgi:hypothetical protein
LRDEAAPPFFDGCEGGAQGILHPILALAQLKLGGTAKPDNTPLVSSPSVRAAVADRNRWSRRRFEIGSDRARRNVARLGGAVDDDGVFLQHPRVLGAPEHTQECVARSVKPRSSDNSTGGAVANLLAAPVATFAPHLRAHVRKFVAQFDLFGDGDGVLSDG